MTSDSHTETLSALCDGEMVDPDVLAAALDDPAARQALVEFLRLRHAVNLDGAPLPRSLGALRRRRLSVVRASVPLPAVAALVVLAVLGAWAIPRPWRAPSSDTPPAPTRVITYVPGVDWHSTR